MMRKIILIVVLVLGILISGVFTVDERQNAVVINRMNQNTVTYTTGLHFAWPLLTQVNYIFTNQRASAFSFKLNLHDNTQLTLTSIARWRVTNPALFLQSNISMGQDGISRALGDKVQQIIATQTKSFSPEDMNQHNLLLEHAVVIDSLGITLDRIVINEISGIMRPTVIAVESNVTVKTIAESSLADANTMMIESAYYQAQMIKTQAEIEQAKMYHTIQIKDPQFYDYFRKLQIYENSARSKQEMPPLQDLYGN